MGPQPTCSVGIGSVRDGYRFPIRSQSVDCYHNWGNPKVFEDVAPSPTDLPGLSLSLLVFCKIGLYQILSSVTSL